MKVSPITASASPSAEPVDNWLDYEDTRNYQGPVPEPDTAS